MQPYQNLTASRSQTRRAPTLGLCDTARAGACWLVSGAGEKHLAAFGEVAAGAGEASGPCVEVGGECRCGDGTKRRESDEVEELHG